MKEVELLIIGSGPAGLCAAISAASSGARVLVLERSFRPGGQLIKQTHMFFGSESQYASHRGVDIADILLSKIREHGDQIEIMLNATAVGFYEDNVVTEQDLRFAFYNDEQVVVRVGVRRCRAAALRGEQLQPILL